MKEFHYDVKSRKGNSFATLTLVAERLFSKHIPTVLQDKNVEGRVHLRLGSPETIKAVTISVQGQYLTGANPDQQFTFLDLSYTLWSQSSGKPPNSNGLHQHTLSPTGLISSSSSSKFDGKLHGDYTWPFSIPLPKDVTLPYGKNNELKTFPLPQTFNERLAKGSINYEVYLRISRGKFQPDDRASVKFGFIPISRPPPFPPMRRLSYQENSPLLGPSADPEGWYSKGPITVAGHVGNHRLAHIACTVRLFLARPLCYTRGSLIPCCFRLESGDRQALDLISAPTAISAFLMRRIRYYSSHHKVGTAYAKDTIEYSQPAVWWPSHTERQEASLNHGPSWGHERARILNGEIHLKPDLKPTSAMLDFRIEYSVVFFPFRVAGFEPSSQDPLLEYPVEIVTSYAHGPRPRKFAPHGYETDRHAQQPLHYSFDFPSLDQP
ncbi:hypothetical protein CPC08DRAFT_634774 [Agrocybe pediades]|nr:hypothetical protein CPC08DRAFT_634774 [Agrocybe pediades]